MPPLNGGDLGQLAQLSAGTYYAGNVLYVRPFDNSLADLSINGGGAAENALLLDGVSNEAAHRDAYNGTNSQMGYIAPVQAVQEFKVVTIPLDAGYGRLQGGVIDMTLKSGTNQIHGSVYEFARRGWLDSNSWANDFYGLRKLSHSYGWWMAGRIYNWNDPDQMLLEGTGKPSGSSTPVPLTANENKSRVTSGAVAGFMFNGDDVTDSAAPPRVQKWLTNSNINGLPALGLNFRPMEGNTGTSPVNVLVAKAGSVYYVAVFNYDIANSLNTTIDLGRAGLNSSATYTVTDL